MHFLPLPASSVSAPSSLPRHHKAAAASSARPVPSDTCASATTPASLALEEYLAAEEARARCHSQDALHLQAKRVRFAVPSVEDALRCKAAYDSLLHECAAALGLSGSTPRDEVPVVAQPGSSLVHRAALI
ncbi:hypothetical protein AB1Y20_007742 [Prymnesium parvum]|uniref:Uncharacterized protein n=1 Tax=Prymnesium parvum TaxID=97485 RepID=A0AB34IWG1_PRYPA